MWAVSVQFVLLSVLRYNRKNMWNSGCLLLVWQLPERWLLPASSLPLHFAGKSTFHCSSWGNIARCREEDDGGIIFSSVSQLQVCYEVEDTLTAVGFYTNLSVEISQCPLHLILPIYQVTEFIKNTLHRLSHYLQQQSLCWTCTENLIFKWRYFWQTREKTVSNNRQA